MYVLPYANSANLKQFQDTQDTVQVDEAVWS